ncbi:hypothetical protein AMTRI_Chr02g220740 [Amborella trichopoda]
MKMSVLGVVKPSTSPTKQALISTPTAHQFITLLESKCTSMNHLKQIHAQITRRGLSQNNFLMASLVKFCAEPTSGNLNYARAVFNQLKDPHPFIWNTMIRGCSENNALEEAILFYCTMVQEDVQPNNFTFPSVFKACNGIKALKEGEQVHTHVIKHGLMSYGHVHSSMIQMYGSGGQLPNARRLFDRIHEPDVVSWNCLIDSHLKNGELEEAKELFQNMPFRSTGSWNAMITGFMRYGLIDEARDLFDEMPSRDEVSWSAMIDGYVQCGHGKEALMLFREMMGRGISPRKFVFSSVLAACAQVGAVEEGRWIHAYLKKNSIQTDTILGTSLIDMYAKCGCLDMAQKVFTETRCQEVSPWNAMIGGLAMHGHGMDAIRHFSRMKREKVRPDGITFIGVLNACAHGGLVEQGLQYFESMKREHNIQPMMEHYGCIVDLLGRAGLLAEAEEFIGSMPVEPSSGVWGALLGACRIHGNLELGERVGKLLLDLEPQNSGRYALLSNIYASAGRWDEVSDVRKLMKDRGIKTTPGCSIIDLDGVIHEFVMGDGMHPQMKEIHEMLKEIMEQLKMEGYVPNTKHVLFNIDEEDKESALCHHSEKLAIAFGFLSTAPGTPIRIVKNLRVCGDCHSATKIISRVYNRELVVRDRVRYHHFKDGMCSCKDYW